MCKIPGINRIRNYFSTENSVHWVHCSVDLARAAVYGSGCGPMMSGDRGFARVQPCGHSGGENLAVKVQEWRGGHRDSHRGWHGVAE
jgi:hypothetical protein